jgi:hypothetical protein
LPLNPVSVRAGASTERASPPAPSVAGLVLRCVAEPDGAGRVVEGADIPELLIGDVSLERYDAMLENGPLSVFSRFERTGKVNE